MEVFKDVHLLSKRWANKSEGSDVAEREIDENGRVDAYSALQEKIVALYFSASWCPACQSFTPLLKELYHELQQRQAPFEIVVVPFDKTKEAAEQYYEKEHGDWLIVTFDDPIISDLKERFDIAEIPKLLVLRPDGTVISQKGRKEVQDKGVICFRNWINATNLGNFSLENEKHVNKNIQS